MTLKTKIDGTKIASILGAEIINIPELTKEESSQYEPLGSPVMIPSGLYYLKDNQAIYHHGSCMLARYGKSLCDVVGYRVLNADEEQEFREECGNTSSIVVRYYGNRGEEGK